MAGEQGEKEKNMERPKGLGRRDVIKGVGIAAGAAAIWVAQDRIRQVFKTPKSADFEELPAQVVASEFKYMESTAEKNAFLAALYVSRGVNPLGGKVPPEERLGVAFDTAARLRSLDVWGKVSIRQGSPITLESAEGGDIIILNIPTHSVSEQENDLDGTISSPFHLKKQVSIERRPLTTAAYTVLTSGEDRTPIECLILFSPEKYFAMQVEWDKRSPLSTDGDGITKMGLYSPTGFFVIPLSERGRALANLKVDDGAFEHNKKSLMESLRDPNRRPVNDYGPENNQRIVEWANSLKLPSTPLNWGGSAGT